MKKFQERMQGVLPPEELPAFFSALETMGASPRKSVRLRRDLGDERRALWTPEKCRSFGVPIGEAVSWYPHGYFFDLPKMIPHPSRHPAIASGLLFIQEAGAMEVVPAMEIMPDHLVLDLCAAPGAKSTHISEYLGEGGWLVANEPVRDRAKLLDAILMRHGAGNSTVFNLEPHRLAEVVPEIFDRILVDAPCSGESLFAKREERRKDVTHKEVERCALRQRAILTSAARMLAAGGRMIYSTCAYSRTENEDVIEKFLLENSVLKKISECRRFPHRDGVPGGYFAVLEKSGHSIVSREERQVFLRAGIHDGGSHGLVRDGAKRWNGERDRYLECMNRRPREELALEDKILNLQESADLLSGAPLASSYKSHDQVFIWEGERFASVRDGALIYPKRVLG
jgi:16S rRNA C967 or C1407 C5-methylase (RsmB/RsmF family)